jgi:4-amino-4-deoxy-L-arabinose transferase-like glycosyltransferase
VGSDMTGTHEEKKTREWPWVLLALVFVVAVPVAAYIAKDGTGKKAAWLIVAQVAATAMAFLVPQVRQIRARRREATGAERELAARTETRAAMNDALDPILRQLGRISSERLKPARKELIAATVPFVLHAASNLIGPHRSRACWFELIDDNPTRLVPAQHAGRSGSPRTNFTEGTPRR